MLRAAEPTIAAQTVAEQLQERLDRVQAELEASNAALAESEHRWRTMLESTTDHAIIVTDLAGRVTSWNEGARTVLGWAEPEIVSRDAALIFTPEDRAAGIPEAEMRQALAEGSAVNERWHLRRDGSQFWASATLTPLRDVAGTAVGHLKILRNRTEQQPRSDMTRRSEVRLRARAELLEAEVAERRHELDRTWQLSQDLLATARLDATLLAVNPAWTAILGWVEEALVRRCSLDLVHPADHAATRVEFERLAGGFSPRCFINRIQHHDGNWRWISWTAVLDRSLIFATGRDVTAEREAAAALRAAEERLQQVQRMEAVGQLTGGIAHDFNNMLQGVVGGLELLERRIQQGRAAESSRYVEIMRSALDRAAALVQRLLAFARRQRLEPRPIDPNALIAGMAELIRGTAGPTIMVELHLGDGAWTVLCDPGQLENVLLSLAINACDAMPKGGRLTISTAGVCLAEADVTGQDDAVPGDYVEIAVADTGMGMTEDVLARAFEPFFTTKPVGQGTGLGLSQLYGFVRQSDGAVRMESAPGRGTTVRIYLPYRAQARASGTQAADVAGQPLAGRGETLLLIEDEASVRVPTAEHLREMGYQVLEAGDGLTGLRALSSAARVDLLLTDVGLPGLNGRQVAEAARAHCPHLSVLLITGYAGSVVDGTLPAGMAVLSKPFALDSLAARVRTMLDEDASTRDL